MRRFLDIECNIKEFIDGYNNNSNYSRPGSIGGVRIRAHSRTTHGCGSVDPTHRMSLDAKTLYTTTREKSFESDADTDLTLATVLHDLETHLDQVTVDDALTSSHFSTVRGSLSVSENVMSHSTSRRSLSHSSINSHPYQHQQQVMATAGATLPKTARHQQYAAYFQMLQRSEFVMNKSKSESDLQEMLKHTNYRYYLEEDMAVRDNELDDNYFGQHNDSGVIPTEEEECEQLSCHSEEANVFETYQTKSLWLSRRAAKDTDSQGKLFI